MPGGLDRWSLTEPPAGAEYGANHKQSNGGDQPVPAFSGSGGLAGLCLGVGAFAIRRVLAGCVGVGFGDQWRQYIAQPMNVKFPTAVADFEGLQAAQRPQDIGELVFGWHAGVVYEYWNHPHAASQRR